MDKIIKVKDSQVASFSAFIRAEQDKLTKEIASLEETISLKRDQYKDNENLIFELGLDSGSSLNGRVNSTIQKDKVIGIKSALANHGSWWDKIQFVLDKSKKPLTAKEILDEIYNCDPKIKGQPIKRNEINVFATLSNKDKSGRLKRIKTRKGASLYGRVEWFDERSNLKIEYVK